MKIKTRMILLVSIFSLLVIFSGTVNLFLIYSISESIQKTIPQTITKLNESSNLVFYASSIKYYDEVLTQSARNYAFTQDDAWAKRYMDVEPKLDDAIKNVIMNGDKEVKRIFYSINDANIRLVKLENRSMNLVNEGKIDEAVQLLESKEYWTLKEQYTEGLIQFHQLADSQYNYNINSSLLTLDSVINSVSNQFRMNLQVIAVLIFIFVIIAIYLSYSSIKSLVDPITTLRNAVFEITSGDNAKDIVPSGDKEIQELTKTFNQMKNSISKQHEEMNSLLSAIDEADIIAKTDKNGDITYVNKKFCEISKYSHDELIGKNHRLLKSDHHLPEFYDDLWNTISSGRIWRGEIQNRAKDGSKYWVKTVIVPKIEKDGKPEEYLAIRTDITNRKIAEEELQKALKRIRENESMIKMQLEEIKISGKQKDEFASMISHELKSPLTPIIGYCDLLRQPELSKDYTDLHLEAIDEISSNAKRLERITMDLLDINKLHMRKLFFHKQNFSLSKFMDSVKKEYSYLTTKKQIQFFVNPVDDQTIYSDEPRLRQVMGNLIRNAIDFVSEGVGKITIDVSTNSANVTFSIQDNGIGITKEKQKDLFKKFFQVDSTFSRSHGGTGLGLAICKGIMEGLGGKIWVKSEVGKGTTFYFQLPINLEKPKTNNTQKGVSK